MEKESPNKIEYEIGDKYKVPVEGSIGLLALGYQGLVAWREARYKSKDTMAITEQE